VNKFLVKSLAAMRDARMTKAAPAQSTSVPMSQIQQTGGSQTVSQLNAYWFSALRPIGPQAPKSYRPRKWPFVPGWNQIWAPRDEEGNRVPYDILYACAEEWDLFSAAMETVIDKITSLDWQVRKKTASKTAEAKIQAGDDPIADKITKFFMKPCRIAGMDTTRGFFNALLTDMYIGDCATIWIERNIAKQVISLSPVDGTTIKCLLDDTGRRPSDLNPDKVANPNGLKDAAFQQINYGLPVAEFTEDEIIYAVRKPRNRSPYGRSHLEQILTWANIGIRAQRFLLEYYTSGNTPEMLIPVDASTPADKVEEWNEMLDTELSGQLGERRKIKMVPVMNTSGKFEPVFPKAPLLVSQLDEFLARIVCFCLGLNPQAFVKSMNRSTSEQAQDQAEAEGQAPVINWLEDVMNECIIRMGYGDTHEFTFRIAREQDGLKQMQIDTGYLAKGVWSINMVLEDLGMDLIQEPWADNHYIDTPTGAVPMDQLDAFMAATIKKMTAPPPAPVPAPKPGNQSPAEQVAAIQKSWSEVLTLVKAHNPKTTEAADKLEAKLATKLKALQAAVESKIRETV
jgi:hypothetical protein